MSVLAGLVVCVSPTADFSSAKATPTRAKVEKFLSDKGAKIVKSVTKTVKKYILHFSYIFRATAGSFRRRCGGNSLFNVCLVSPPCPSFFASVV